MKRFLLLSSFLSLSLLGCSPSCPTSQKCRMQDELVGSSPFAMGDATYPVSCPSCGPSCPPSQMLFTPGIPLAPGTAAAPTEPEKDPACSCGKDCKCKQGECKDTNCPTMPTKPTKSAEKSEPKKKCNCPCDCGCCESGVCICCKLSFEQGKAQALKEGKALVLWIGVVCPTREKDFAKLVNAYEEDVPAFFKIQKKAPYVIIGRVEGGAFTDWRGFDHVPSLAEAQSVVGLRRRVPPARSVPRQPQTSSTVPSPMSVPMSSRPMMMPTMPRFFRGGGGGC